MSDESLNQWILELELYQIVLFCTVFLLVGIEFLFYIYVTFIVSPTLQALKKPEPPLFKDPITSLRDVYSMLESLDSYDFKRWISGLFLFGKFEDIQQENFIHALAWIIYTKEFNSLSQEECGCLVELREESLKKFNVTMPEGCNPNIQHVNFNLEAVSHIHKPLALYGILHFLEAYDIFLLYIAGFHRYTLPNGTTYWFKPAPVEARIAGMEPSNESSTLLDNSMNKTSVKLKAPILLLHGICPGWGYYTSTIKAYSDRAVILYNYNCIRFSWITLQVPGPVQVCDSICEILTKHNISKVSLIGHSWGTFTAGWLVRLRPQVISHFTLIEPVALTVILFETTYCILYKPPVNFTDYLLYYFVRNDISLSNTLHRNFFWYNMSLRLEDIPNNIPIVISFNGLDDLICPEAANELIDRHIAKRKEDSMRNAPITKIFWPKLRHGDTPDTPSAVHEIKAAIDAHESDSINFYTSPKIVAEVSPTLRSTSNCF